MSDERNEALKERLKAYALQIIDLYTVLPKTEVARVIGRRFLRSGTSIGAHHREACRARSKAEFISKLETALQELDETDYWLGLLISSGNGPDSARGAIQETNELISILTAIVKSAKGKGKE